MNALLKPDESEDLRETEVPAKAAGTGEKKQREQRQAAPDVLAGGAANGASLAGTLDPVVALLESVEQAAPASCSPTPA